MGKVTCPNCKAENFGTDSQCMECGAALVRPVTAAGARTSRAEAAEKSRLERQQVRCRSCGKTYWAMVDAERCPHCGAQTRTSLLSLIGAPIGGVILGLVALVVVSKWQLWPQYKVWIVVMACALGAGIGRFIGSVAMGRVPGGFDNPE